MQKNNLTCYRLFDWDMPEYPLCIDKYENKIHVAEYKTKHPLNDHDYQIWMNESLEAIKEVFNIGDELLFVKRRERQKGDTQYEKVADTKQFDIVHENGFNFLVNMNDYLDTGLFLDHRLTRLMAMKEAQGKKVLNLFAYTGSFSVYTLAGGASHVTTVDLSNTYLNWAKENFKVNGFDPERHQFIKTDVKEWIKNDPEELFDLVILDPPTVSRSKMSKSKFDIQPDHPELIHHVLKHMSKGGILYFSTNFRDFQFQSKRIQASSIQDISFETIPDDFRNKKIHYCWKIIK
ncbi:MAG TPA: class I SAM-dependent methyltransferase [Chitinophagaceae bacterium]|nr:class I SAM-dependent methyltransferase [Chitinophagaceae bacterium]